MKDSIKNLLRKLNTEQKKAVECSHNAVVSAGAGSGKTTVLAKRFVYLILKEGIPVEEILSLTFTKKAAAQMSDKIYETLVKTYETDKSKELKTAINNFDQAEISTIDSFCNKIAKNGCEKYGISPDFSINNKKSQDLAKKCAFNCFMNHKNDDNFKKLFSGSDVELFITNWFEHTLNNYVVFTKEINFKESFQKQKLYMEELFYKEKQNNIIDKIDSALNNLSNTDLAFINEAKRLFNKLDKFPKTYSDINYEFLENIYNIIKFTKLKKNQKNFEILVQLYIFNNNEELINYVSNLLSNLQKDFLEQKKQANILNYNDVSQLAITILQDNIEVRNYYKNKFKKIMIDEFQDNNNLQKELLFLISEKVNEQSPIVNSINQLDPNKLFFVGDDKQSIYLFRGADVSVFNNLKEEVNTTNEKINLNTNYRSQTQLINIFNFIFKQIFISEKKPELDYEAGFEEVIASKNNEEIKPELKILIANGLAFKFNEDKKNCLSKDEAQAYILAQEIRKMKDKQTKIWDKENEKIRTCEWKDFAILMRTGGKQAVLEKYLRKFNIPYKSIQQKAIFKYAPINDMFALLKLTVYPHDKFSYAQVLRAPYSKLSDNAFAKILLSERNTKDFTAFKTNTNSLDKADKISYNELKDIYEELNKKTYEFNNTQLVSYLWHELGYKYLIESNSEYKNYIDLYDYFFALANNADLQGMTLVEFITLIDNYITGDKMDDMDIPLAEDSNSDNNSSFVDILTIHKSKGLEFPIVCIYDCGNDGSNDNEPNVFISKKYGASYKIPHDEVLNIKAKNYIYEEEKKLKDKKNIAETKRLLYVAMTRAESHIIMTGIRPIPGQSKANDCDNLETLMAKFKAPKESTTKTSLYNLLLPAFLDGEKIKTEVNNLNITIDEIKPITKEEAKSTLAEMKSSSKKLDNLEKLKEYAKIPQKEFKPAEQKLISASHYDAIVNDKTYEKNQEHTAKFKTSKSGAGSSATLSATELGTLSHKALEMYFKDEEFTPPPEAKEEVENFLQTFLDSDFGEMAEKAKKENKLYTEYKLITKYKGKKVYGEVDLIFEDDQTIFVIDYKTDREEVSEHHETQLDIYKRAVRDIFNANKTEKKEVKAYLFYLRSGNTVEIKN